MFSRRLLSWETWLGPSAALGFGRGRVRAADDDGSGPVLAPRASFAAGGRGALPGGVWSPRRRPDGPGAGLGAFRGSVGGWEALGSRVLHGIARGRSAPRPVSRAFQAGLVAPAPFRGLARRYLRLAGRLRDDGCRTQERPRSDGYGAWKDRLEEEAVRGESDAICRPGGDRLSRVLRRSIIGAEAFHGRVRNGIGWGHLAGPPGRQIASFLEAEASSPRADRR